MALIDIGSGAIDRTTVATTDYTLIDFGNPANGTGTLTSIELWFNTAATGVKAGTFYGTSPDFTPRDVETIGNVASGSKQTFSGLDCDVTSGDLVGMYAGTGQIEYDTPETGADPRDGVAYKQFDQFGAGQQTYTVDDDAGLSIYATGSTVSILIFTHHYKMMVGD